MKGNAMTKRQAYLSIALSVVTLALIAVNIWGQG